MKPIIPLPRARRNRRRVADRRGAVPSSWYRGLSRTLAINDEISRLIVGRHDPSTHPQNALADASALLPNEDADPHAARCYRPPDRVTALRSAYHLQEPGQGYA